MFTKLFMLNIYFSPCMQKTKENERVINLTFWIFYYFLLQIKNIAKFNWTE